MRNGLKVIGLFVVIVGLDWLENGLGLGLFLVKAFVFILWLFGLFFVVFSVVDVLFFVVFDRGVGVVEV